ncbi:MAG TPA: phosphatidylglycerol lysyltransferase domain-containing protein [Candidatus Saccharimonadales bacterium]
MDQDSAASYEHAHELLNKYGGEADDFFKLWPADKTYYFSSDKQAFIAYGIRLKVAVCMGNPVGPEESVGMLLSEFKDFCAKNGLVAIFIQATDKYQKSFKSNGMRSILIGADANIDINTFTTKTLNNKYFRNLVNRSKKNQFKVDSYLPPHSKGLIDELREVSDSWIKLPHRKEWSFLTGSFDVDYLQQVPLHVLRDKNGIAEAFTNELPSFKPRVATIDLMRRRFDSPPNSIDLLFIGVMQEKLRQGYKSFNLGMSPLDGKPFAKNRSAKILIHLYKISNRFIGFSGLHHFKAKYEPNWQPQYVWYQGSPFRLVQMGLAISKLMKSS